MGVLRLRAFRLLFGAQAVSWFGDRMVPIALAFAVLSLHGSASDVGLVLAVRMAPLIATLLVGGVVADRLSRRAVMVAADLSRVLTQGAIATLLITHHASIATLAILSGATGAATGFFNPASTGLMPAVVPAERLQEANGIRATAMSGGEIVGPAIAGVLIAAVGPGWALATDAATFALSALLLARLTLPERAARTQATSFLTDLRAGWGMFRSLTWVWTFVLGAGVGNLAWGAWSSLGPVVAERSLGGAAVWGSILAALGVGALAGGIIAVRARPARPLIAATLTYSPFTLTIAFLAAGAPAVILAVGAFGAGLAMMLGNALWESTLMRHVPDEWLSRVSAYDWFGSLAFQPLGLIVWGLLAGVIGISPTLWIAAAITLISNLGMLSTPAIRRLRDEPQPV